MTSPIFNSIVSALKSQSKLQLAEHVVALGAVLYVAKKISHKGLSNFLTDLAFSVVKATPAQKLIDGETDKVIQKIGDMFFNPASPKFVPHLASARVNFQVTIDVQAFTTLPDEGVSEEAVINLLKEMREHEVDFNNGKAFGGIYHDIEEINRVMIQAETIFHDSNALFPTIFPGLRKMEIEVVKMTAKMLNAGDEAVGSLTCGGTESILMAIKAYKELAIQRGISEPEIVCPVSAHAAFAKGATYFGLKFVCVPVRDSDKRVDPETIRKAINRNTAMIVASSPGYPHGVVDPIEQIAAIAKEHEIPFHVDGCLGGFVLPWLSKLGLFTEKFDFSLPGVTSMTADIHKYGFGPKGTAVLVYRNASYRKHQFYATTHWSGGLYASPSMTGSRPGSSIAGAWATLVHIGANGYLEKAKQMSTLFKLLTSEFVKIAKINGLVLLGPPDACCISFNSNDFDILKIADVMEEMGWKNLNRMQKPACLMIQVGLRSKFDPVQFIDALRAAVEKVKSDPQAGKDGMAAIYGMAEKIPSSSGIGDKILEGYLDALYK